MNWAKPEPLQKEAFLIEETEMIWLKLNLFIGL